MNPTDPPIENGAGTRISTSGQPIPVVACGPGWMVVEKPCGLSIHNDPGNDLCSVALAAVHSGLLPAVGARCKAVNAVHRLDRDTSGIVLLAGNPQNLAFFGDQFAARTVHKHYLALVHGRLDESSAMRERIDWTWPLTRGAAGRHDPGGRGKRLPCTTRWRTLAHSRHYSLLDCEPLTGRRHQIRRHAKLAGHPVVGDRRYGTTRSLTYLSQHCGFDRLGLHAHSLTLQLPHGNRPVTFHSGGLPRAMERLLEADCSD